MLVDKKKKKRTLRRWCMREEGWRGLEVEGVDVER
jgi:hypothetical protein